MALALNNLQRVDMPLNKETKETKLLLKYEILASSFPFDNKVMDW